MSYVDTKKLKGVLDPTLAFFTSTLAFTTAVLTVDALSQFGCYIKTFRIVNNDGAANLTYIQGGQGQPPKIVPPNSEVVVEGWESFVQITPNGATGVGILEMDLVQRQDAIR